ncbi:MAG: ECF transporter S component [Clostridia bacterium]|nr:ECF transporter S component [Clostridia bacterium]
MQTKTSFNIKKLTYLAMLTALIILLQLVIAPLIGAATGLSPSLVLIPIVLGVASCGIGAGAWLGAVFSFIVMFDPTTVPFLEFNPILTVLLVFVKGVGAALIAGLLFKLLQKRNKYLAVIVAAISAPIANTGIFVIGCLLFFRALTGVGIYSLFITVNFALEVIVNAVFVPVVYHLLEATGILNKR